MTLYIRNIGPPGPGCGLGFCGDAVKRVYAICGDVIARQLDRRFMRLANLLPVDMNESLCDPPWGRNQSLEELEELL